MKRLRYQATNGPIAIELAIQKSYHKPTGLWYSVGEERKEWCDSEGFRLEQLAHVYELDINLDRVLRITTERELREFTRLYSDETCWNIDWEAVAREWDGIEIAPYQWGCRMATATRWYYSWDVASGCLWRPEALREARLRDEN